MQQLPGRKEKNYVVCSRKDGKKEKGPIQCVYTSIKIWQCSVKKKNDLEREKSDLEKELSLLKESVGFSTIVRKKTVPANTTHNVLSLVSTSNRFDALQTPGKCESVDPEKCDNVINPQNISKEAPSKSTGYNTVNSKYFWCKPKHSHDPSNSNKTCETSDTREPYISSTGNPRHNAYLIGDSMIKNVDTICHSSPSPPSSTPPPSTPSTLAHFSNPQVSLPSTSTTNTASSSSPLSHRTPKSSGKRLKLADIGMSRLVHCTPRKKLLYLFEKDKVKKLEKLRAAHEKLKAKAKTTNGSGKKPLSADHFLKSILSKPFVAFFQSQSQTLNKKPKGRRWIFGPCSRMLQRLLGSSPFSVGIHKKALANLIQALADKEPHNRLCLLLFDEMAIRHFDYKVASDTITGFEDHGILGESKKTAKYALVFMVWGLLQDCHGSPTNPERLKELLELVLRECSEAGLQMISTVCDTGSNNVKALKLIGSTVERRVINLAGQEFITIYDPPNLLKSTRNLFLKHDELQNIREAFEWDSRHAESRTLRKLTPIYIEPKGRSKLVITCMYSCRFLPSSALATSRFVWLVDNMFDSMNGGVQLDVGHRSVRKLVDSWEFLEDSSSYPEVPDINRPPTVTGWLTTLTAMEMIWDKVMAMKVKKLSTRRLNQDPLENFFGCLRAQCRSNRDPTMSSFIDAWKTCIFSGLPIGSTLKGTDCLEDGAELLSRFDEVLEEDRHELTPSSPISFSTPDVDISHPRGNAKDLCRFIAVEVLGKSTCRDCRKGLLDVLPHEDPDFDHLFVEVVGEEQHFVYPSEGLIRILSICRHFTIDLISRGPALLLRTSWLQQLKWALDVKSGALISTAFQNYSIWFLSYKFAHYQSFSSPKQTDPTRLREKIRNFSRNLFLKFINLAEDKNLPVLGIQSHSIKMVLERKRSKPDYSIYC
ncbi:hypothetical protein J437_LFUL015353 [Ladona fulva]|uniref:Transposase n=1 Tax=Ladona fulva TaxID=123851 RepID=A0A8K0KHS0_LADFU|nr:hypothetical protein J437_LFUL015353 [Ladona fulva]